MDKKKLVIYGIGKFAEYVHYVFEQDSSYEVCGFSMEAEFNTGKASKIAEQPIVSFEQLEEHFAASEHELFIAVGNNHIRERIFQAAKKKGYRMANYISSKASTWENLECGQNVFIDEGTMLQPFVKIGDSSILFASSIGHHTSIGSHCLVSGVTTGGNVSIGDHSYVGMNSVIKQDTSIGEKNAIGMGCVIEKDTQPGAVFSSKGTVKRSSSYEQIAERFLK